MKDDATQLRPSIDQALANGAWPAARMHLAQLWATEPGPATANYVTSCFEKLKAHATLNPCRLFVLRSFTLEPVSPLIRAAAAIAGIDLSVQLGEFNAYDQEILDANSPLHASRPDVVILAVQTRDAAPDLWERFAELSRDEVQAAADRLVDEMDRRFQSFRRQNTASLIVHGFEMPSWPAAGLADAQNPAGQAATLHAVNRRIRELASRQPGVYFLDYDALMARVGRVAWHDPRKWLTMRMPIAAGALGFLAHEWLRFLSPLAGRSCKALVTDLDNTLWGGVVGEDGMDGLKMGPEHPGAAYREIQRALLDLHHRGILLAVCSKNNPPEALEVLEKHPDMLLRPAHFSALRINWNDKAQNLREIAAELNIGIDALAFLDDNPTERQRVRLELPDVAVIELPDNPAGFATVLRQHPALERLTLSAEDRERSRLYAEQHDRATLQHGSGSVEEFLRALDQQIEIAPVRPSNRARVAQLTQKTNQFNLTTRRYSEQEIDVLAQQPGCEAWAVRVADRFGDNGIVGVMITRQVTDRHCHIDTLLLSCRVIGRTVETAMLSFLADRARNRGDQVLEGWFLPTKKNAPASGFYSSHGFAPAEHSAAGTRWTLDLRPTDPPTIQWPPWITLVPCPEKIT